MKKDLRSTWIKICPGCYEFSQVMRAKNGRVTCEVVKIIHDDGHEQVQHDERAEEDERYEVDIRHVWSTSLFWIQKSSSSFVPLIGIDIAWPTWQPIQHNVRPGFTSSTPSQGFSFSLHFNWLSSSSVHSKVLFYICLLIINQGCSKGTILGLIYG